MAYSTSKQINDIASQYVQNVGSGSDLQYAVAGVTSDLEMSQLNNAWNAEQVQKQMDYETEMSNTAHQREVVDLIRAGINPVLSAKLGGASTPSVSAASADTGATGTASSSSSTAVQAKVARENALVQAQAQISAASIAASAQKYSADMAYKTAELNNENPNSMAGLLREVLEGIFGDSVKGTASSAKDNVLDTATKVLSPEAQKASVTGYHTVNASFYKSGMTYAKYQAFLDSNTRYRQPSLVQHNHTWNIKYSDFRSIEAYREFCNYFGLKPLSSYNFYTAKGNGSYVFK